MSRITMVYIIKKVTIYILYPIKELYLGFIYLCIKKPHRKEGYFVLTTLLYD